MARYIPRILLAAALAACLLSPGLGQGKKAPATERLAAYVEAFNSGSPETMREFFEAHYADSALAETSLETRLARYPTSRARLGPFVISKILAERADETYALARAGKGGNFLLRAKVEKEAPHKLLFIFVESVDDPQDIILPDPKPDGVAFAAAVRTFLEGEVRADRFSGVVLVARGNEVLFHEAHGYADRERKIPNRKDTKFNLGSINKSFTRAAVLRLAKQGKLSPEDTIGKYLPDYPNAEAARKVTIRHLLDMTSGPATTRRPRRRSGRSPTICPCSPTGPWNSSRGRIAATRTAVSSCWGRSSRRSAGRITIPMSKRTSSSRAA
jgi:hypothetical protein